MQVTVELTDQAIDPAGLLPPDCLGPVGGLVTFEGLVRGQEAGTPITALEYEAYRPMAEQQMVQIIHDIAAIHPCIYVAVIHRLGVVPVGASAIRVVAAAPHRAEAFAMVARFLDRLKQDVPIWKVRALKPADSDAVSTS